MTMCLFKEHLIKGNTYFHTYQECGVSVLADAIHEMCGGCTQQCVAPTEHSSMLEDSRKYVHRNSDNSGCPFLKRQTNSVTMHRKIMAYNMSIQGSFALLWKISAWKPYTLPRVTHHKQTL